MVKPQDATMVPKAAEVKYWQVVNDYVLHWRTGALNSGQVLAATDEEISGQVWKVRPITKDQFDEITKGNPESAKPVSKMDGVPAFGKRLTKAPTRAQVSPPKEQGTPPPPMTGSKPPGAKVSSDKEK